MRQWLETIAVALFVLLAVALGGHDDAYAQQQSYAKTVSACGTAPNTPVVGNPYPNTQDTNGRLCTATTTSPSGTQDVNVKQVNGHTVTEGAGATGNGSQRVTVAQDSTTVAGSSSLPAGTNSVGSLNAATHAQSAALAANLVAKNAAGNLYSFEVNADSTLSAATWYVMVYDAISAPVDGAVTPAKCYQVPSGITQMGGTFASGGVAFSTGITIGVGTTGCFTKTASTHAFIGADFQ